MPRLSMMTVVNWRVEESTADMASYMEAGTHKPGIMSTRTGPEPWTRKEMESLGVCALGAARVRGT